MINIFNSNLKRTNWRLIGTELILLLKIAIILSTFEINYRYKITLLQKWKSTKDFLNKVTSLFKEM